MPQWIRSKPIGCKRFFAGMPKTRLDAEMVSRELCNSQEQAKRFILAGQVLVNGHPSTKPGRQIKGDEEIFLKARPRFVGRGGQKMEGALDTFRIDPKGLTCLDIGASTGGFTDCLLQRGAERVYTLDVGTNQLAWKIRSDPRVVARENFNARYLTPDDLPEKPSLIVIDVSFISLTRILPPAASVLASSGAIICLIKPQFELGRAEVGKGGIINDPHAHQRAYGKIQTFVTTEIDDLEWGGLMDSPITGAEGNREFLALLRRPSESPQH